MEHKMTFKFSPKEIEAIVGALRMAENSLPGLTTNEVVMLCGNIQGQERRARPPRAVPTSYAEAMAVESSEPCDRQALAFACKVIAEMGIAPAPRFPTATPEVLYDGCVALGHSAEAMRNLAHNRDMGGFAAVVAAGRKATYAEAIAEFTRTGLDPYDALQELASTCKVVAYRIESIDHRHTLRHAFPTTAPEVLYDGCVALGHDAEALRDIADNQDAARFADVVVAAANN